MSGAYLFGAPERRTRVICALAVLACVAVGTVFRLHDAGQSLWLDELHTAWTVSGSFADVLPRARLGHQSPLFFWLEWCSVQLFGLTEWGLRLPSLVAGIALIPTIAAVAVRWSGSLAAGALAAGLAAADYYCVFYAQDARPYALLQLVALLHAAVFFELCQRPSWGLRAGFVIGGVLLFHLHYVASLLLAGELTYYGLITIREATRPEYRPRHLVCDLALTGLGMAPALPWIWTTATERGNWASFVPIPGVGDLFRLFPITSYVVLPLLAAVAVEYVRSRRPWIDCGARARRSLCFLVCWLIVPLLIAWMCTTLDVARIFYRRYLLICAVTPLLASAVLMPRFSKVPQATFLIVVLVLSQSPAGRQLLPAALAPPPPPLSNHLRSGKFTSHAREDWRGAANIVRSAVGKDRLPVFVRSGLIESAGLSQDHSEALREYSLLPVTSIYSLRQHDQLLSPLPPADRVRLTPAQLEQVSQQGGGWLILRGNFAIERVVEESLSDLRAHGTNARLVDRWDLRGVTVLLIAVRG